MAPIVPEFVRMAEAESRDAASAQIQLPNGPSTLSFDKDDFANAQFRVDDFIAKHRRAGVPLETLKEDLSLYLDVLETSMFDLINRDYQDFVSLSSNLVGLDSAIDDLSRPLVTIKSDVSKVQSKIKEALEKLNDAISERNGLREKRRLLQRFLTIEERIKKLQFLLGPSGVRSDANYGDVVEQAAHQWVTLQLDLKFDRKGVEALVFLKERRSTVDVLGDSLTKKAASMLEACLESNETERLRQSLRIFVIMDKIGDAEDIFRRSQVTPGLSAIFDEYASGAGRTTSEILTSLYARILAFVPDCLSTVKDLVSSSQATEGRAGNEAILRGYDFMTGSVWPEVARLLTTKVQNIFSPGNPDQFHANYSVTVSFLERLEGLCASQASVKRLRSHASHVTFLSKWNLPVYFQIRFQEIAGTFETALLDGWKKTEEFNSPAQLKSTSVLLACLNVCWIPSVFLDPLLPKFWKLTLQLLSRYGKWMDELMSSLDLKESKVEKSIGPSPNSAPSSSSNPSSSAQSSPSDLNHESKLELVVDLISDVGVVRDSMTALFESSVWPRVRGAGFSDRAALFRCLDSSCKKMDAKLEPFVEFVVGILFLQSSSVVRQVNDVPRKYRKTNREAPSKASPYVGAMLEPLEGFGAKTSAVEATKKIIVARVLAQIVALYSRHVADVLTSVQKMEESLKRLKKARGGGASATTGSSVEAVSDDDKIRLQLSLDVRALGELIKMSFDIDPESLEHFLNLKALVVEATAGLAEMVATESGF